MFKPEVISRGVRADFADASAGAFAPNASRVAYGTAGFRTIGSALPPIAYRCAFVVFCRSLSVRLSISTASPYDSHRYLINPTTIGDCGVMITASHNPAADNGLKIIDPDAGMFTMDWEADATDLANISDADTFGAALADFARQRVLMGTADKDEAPILKLLRERPVRIHVGRDTRPTGSAILASFRSAVATINATFAPVVFGTADASKRNIAMEIVDHGVLTTPILHAMVYWNRHHHELPLGELGLTQASNPAPSDLEMIAKVSGTHGPIVNARFAAVDGDESRVAANKLSIATALSTPITKPLNERLVFRAFLSLWENFDLRHQRKPRTVVVDCSNGVGAVVLAETLNLPLTLLTEDKAFLALVGEKSTTDDVCAIGKLVEAVTGIRFKLVHDDVNNHALLNKDCGADHTQKTRIPSKKFADELEAFVAEHSEALYAEMKRRSSSGTRGAKEGLFTPQNFCNTLSNLLGFYCFDGDADRVVAFVARPAATKTGEGGESGDSYRPEIESPTKQEIHRILSSLASQAVFELLDGDRIAVLMSSLVRDALRRPCSASSLSRSGNSTPSHTHSRPRDPQIGVVQTAYANGASTNFITTKLHIPVVCAATGVKYLHPKAEAMEVGVYFEANGHGTALSAPSLYAAPVTLPSPSKSASSSTTSNEGDKQHNTITPFTWFGKHPSLSSPPDGLKHLMLLRLLLSQCCGDALADMLASELALASLGWNALHWLTMYDDLPSITGKTTVKDPSVIKNTPDQRQATHPVGLQPKIDAIVAEVGGDKVLARSFVRPSGTEPIVRVYAEATTPEVTNELFEKVAAAVREMCQ